MLTRLKNISYSAKTHQGFRRYFANTSWIFAEQILRMMVGLVVGIWVARYLGPEQFGVFSYVLAFVSIFGGLAKLGLDSIIVRDLVNTPQHREIYLGTAFWLKLAGAILALVVISLSIPLTRNDDRTNLYIFIIASGLFFQSFEVVDFYFQSKVISKFVSACKIVQLFFSSLIKVYLVLTGADLIWFVAASLVDQIILSLTLIIVAKQKGLGFFYNQFDKRVALMQLSDSWPLIFSSLVVMLYMRIDQIMIKEIIGEKEVGIYSAAVRLSEAWYFIPMIVTNSLFPAIVNSKRISEEVYRNRLQKFYTLMVWIALSVSIPVSFLSDWLVVFLYGDAFKTAGPVLMINVSAGVFVFLGVASGSWLISENLQFLAFYRTFCGLIVNISLNSVLIPKYGLIGAAVATVVSYMVAGLLFDYFHEKTKSTFFMKVNAFLFKTKA